MTLLLFDVDLTLVNTGGAGVRALNRAFERVLGLTGALEGIVPHGKTDPAIIREVCVTQGIPWCGLRTGELVDCYLELLKEEVAQSEQYRILPGVVPLLKKLSRLDDAGVGLATGNVEAGARIKLERAGLNAYFPFGGYGSDSEDRTEVVLKAAHQGARWHRTRLDPTTTFVIGDTPRDVLAGKTAGFRTVGVATGRHGVALLEEAGADLAIDDFEKGRSQFFRSTRIV